MKDWGQVTKTEKLNHRVASSRPLCCSKKKHKNPYNEEKNENKYMHLYVLLKYYAVHQKSTPHCKLTVLQ